MHLICNKTESAFVLTSKLGIILGFAFVAEIGGRRGLQKNHEGVGSHYWKVGVRTTEIRVFLVELRSQWKQRIVRWVMHLSSDEDDWEELERTDLERSFGAAIVFVRSRINDNSLNNEVKMKLHGYYQIATQSPCHEP